MGFKPTPLAIQVSTLTSRPLTPPIPWHPYPRAYAGFRSRDLDLYMIAIYSQLYLLHLHICPMHLCKPICAMDICHFCTWRHLPSAKYFSDVSLILIKRQEVLFNMGHTRQWTSSTQLKIWSSWQQPTYGNFHLATFKYFQMPWMQREDNTWSSPYFQVEGNMNMDPCQHLWSSEDRKQFLLLPPSQMS